MGLACARALPNSKMTRAREAVIPIMAMMEKLLREGEMLIPVEISAPTPS